MWYEDELELALEDEGIDPSDLADDPEGWDEEWGEDAYLDSYWEDQLEMGFNPYEGAYDFDC